MDSTLRPMSTSQVLDRTFFLYRKHFLVFAGIAMVAPALALVVELGFVPLGYMPGAKMTISPEAQAVLAIPYYMLILGFSLFGGALAEGASVYAVSRIHLGHDVTIGEAYRQVLSRFGTVLWIFIRVSVRAIGPYVPAFALFVGLVLLVTLSGTGGSGRTTFLALLGLGLLLGLLLILGATVWSLYIYSKYALAVPACLLEKPNARDAIQRSRLLAANSVGRIMLVFFLLSVLTALFSLILELPSEIYSGMHHGILTTPFLLWQYISTFVASVLAGPIATIAIALIYYDQRVRKEAYDLQLMMQSLEPPGAMPAHATPVS